MKDISLHLLLNPHLLEPPFQALPEGLWLPFIWEKQPGYKISLRLIWEERPQMFLF